MEQTPPKTLANMAAVWRATDHEITKGEEVSLNGTIVDAIASEVAQGLQQIVGNVEADRIAAQLAVDVGYVVMLQAAIGLMPVGKEKDY